MSRNPKDDKKKPSKDKTHDDAFWEKYKPKPGDSDKLTEPAPGYEVEGGK